MKFEEFEAAVAGGLDLEKWIMGGYSAEVKSEIVAWYRLRHLIRLHEEDARQIFAKSKYQSKTK